MSRIARRAIPPPRDAANRASIEALMVAVNELSGAVGDHDQRAVRAGELLGAGILQLTVSGDLGRSSSVDTTASALLAQLLTVDGTGSGLDAGLLGGFDATGYFADKFRQSGASIPGGADLNTYTAPGLYHQSATADAGTGTNYPVARAGMLVVYAAGSMVYQTYQDHATGERWHRSYDSATWSSWRKEVQEANNAATLTGHITVDCSGSTVYAFEVWQPGSSPAGSLVSISSPGGLPGVIGIYAGTKRRDIVFRAGDVFIGASATTAGASQGIFINEAGELSVSGKASAQGLELGYRQIPLTVQNAAYTFVAGDAGKGRVHTDTAAYTYTVPANVFAAGDRLTVLNDTGTGAITLAQGTGLTMFKEGTTTTGSRTVAVRGRASILFASPTVCYCDGSGVT